MAPVLAQRAASEGPRWTRAVETNQATLWRGERSEIGRMGRKGQEPFLLAENEYSEGAPSMRAGVTASPLEFLLGQLTPSTERRSLLLTLEPTAS